MNPLRVLGDVLAGRPRRRPPEGAGFAASPAPSGGSRPAHVTSLSERERLMRHTGLPECPIPEHTDALRRLGRVTMERDEARALADLWMRRALRSEAQLRHPAAGQADVA